MDLCFSHKNWILVNFVRYLDVCWLCASCVIELCGAVTMVYDMLKLILCGYSPKEGEEISNSCSIVRGQYS
jgi:hypothetical protein